MVKHPITRIPGDRILLTFDDGPHPVFTTLILDILHVFKAKACFFVCGMHAERHPHLLRRIAEDGHEVGNHTWTHVRLDRASEARVVDEIQATQKLITQEIGRAPRFFRPPYGKYTTAALKIVQDHFDIAVVLWSIDPEDWSRPGTGTIVSRVTEAIEGGDIVLLHDACADSIRACPDQNIARSRMQTVRALPAILSSIRENKLLTVAIAHG
jgi:peptidoglycan/xylan/chitin deacetylase (PgdA/CDA1 family)